MEPTAHDGPPPGVQSETGLRIVLAYDLSAAAERAVALIRSAGWPPGTSVRIATSPLNIGPPISSFASFSQADAHGRDTRRSIDAAQARLALDLRDAGLSADTVSLPGRPGAAIVADAEQVGADVIVAGGPEHGPIAASLLGSVSTELVQTAACSILIVRSTSISRVLLGTDGSMLARAATTLVATWPMFADSVVRVVGVGASVPRYAGIVLSRDERRAA